MFAHMLVCVCVRLRSGFKKTFNYYLVFKAGFLLVTPGSLSLGG